MADAQGRNTSQLNHFGCSMLAPEILAKLESYGALKSLDIPVDLFAVAWQAHWVKPIQHCLETYSTKLVDAKIELDRCKRLYKKVSDEALEMSRTLHQKGRDLAGVDEKLVELKLVKNQYKNAQVRYNDANDSCKKTFDAHIASLKNDASLARYGSLNAIDFGELEGLKTEQIVSSIDALKLHKHVLKMSYRSARWRSWVLFWRRSRYLRDKNQFAILRSQLKDGENALRVLAIKHYLRIAQGQSKDHTASSLEEDKKILKYLKQFIVAGGKSLTILQVLDENKLAEQLSSKKLKKMKRSERKALAKMQSKIETHPDRMQDRIQNIMDTVPSLDIDLALNDSMDLFSRTDALAHWRGLTETERSDFLMEFTNVGETEAHNFWDNAAFNQLAVLAKTFNDDCSDASPVIGNARLAKAYYCQKVIFKSLQSNEHFITAMSKNAPIHDVAKRLKSDIEAHSRKTRSTTLNARNRKQVAAFEKLANELDDVPSQPISPLGKDDIAALAEACKAPKQRSWFGAKQDQAFVGFSEKNTRKNRKKDFVKEWWNGFNGRDAFYAQLIQDPQGDAIKAFWSDELIGAVKPDDDLVEALASLGDEQQTLVSQMAYVYYKLYRVGDRQETVNQTEAKAFHDYLGTVHSRWSARGFANDMSSWFGRNKQPVLSATGTRHVKAIEDLKGKLFNVAPDSSLKTAEDNIHLASGDVETLLAGYSSLKLKQNAVAENPRKRHLETLRRQGITAEGRKAFFDKLYDNMMALVDEGEPPEAKSIWSVFSSGRNRTAFFKARSKRHAYFMNRQVRYVTLNRTYASLKSYFNGLFDEIQLGQSSSSPWLIADGSSGSESRSLGVLEAKTDGAVKNMPVAGASLVQCQWLVDGKINREDSFIQSDVARELRKRFMQSVVAKSSTNETVVDHISSAADILSGNYDNQIKVLLARLIANEPLAGEPVDDPLLGYAVDKKAIKKLRKQLKRFLKKQASSWKSAFNGPDHENHRKKKQYQLLVEIMQSYAFDANQNPQSLLLMVDMFHLNLGAIANSILHTSRQVSELHAQGDVGAQRENLTMLAKQLSMSIEALENQNPRLKKLIPKKERKQWLKICRWAKAMADMDEKAYLPAGHEDAFWISPEEQEAHLELLVKYGEAYEGRSARDYLGLTKEQMSSLRNSNNARNEVPVVEEALLKAQEEKSQAFYKAQDLLSLEDLMLKIQKNAQDIQMKEAALQTLTAQINDEEPAGQAPDAQHGILHAELVVLKAERDALKSIKESYASENAVVRIEAEASIGARDTFKESVKAAYKELKPLERYHVAGVDEESDAIQKQLAHTYLTLHEQELWAQYEQEGMSDTWKLKLAKVAFMRDNATGARGGNDMLPSDLDSAFGSVWGGLSSGEQNKRDAFISIAKAFPYHQKSTVERVAYSKRLSECSQDMFDRVFKRSGEDQKGLVYDYCNLKEAHRIRAVATLLAFPEPGLYQKGFQVALQHVEENDDRLAEEILLPWLSLISEGMYRDKDDAGPGESIARYLHAIGVIKGGVERQALARNFPEALATVKGQMKVWLKQYIAGELSEGLFIVALKYVGQTQDLSLIQQYYGVALQKIVMKHLSGDKDQGTFKNEWLYVVGSYNAVMGSFADPRHASMFKDVDYMVFNALMGIGYTDNDYTPSALHNVWHAMEKASKYTHENKDRTSFCQLHESHELVRQLLFKKHMHQQEGSDLTLGRDNVKCILAMSPYHQDFGRAKHTQEWLAEHIYSQDIPLEHKKHENLLISEKWAQNNVDPRDANWKEDSLGYVRKQRVAQLKMLLNGPCGGGIRFVGMEKTREYCALISAHVACLKPQQKELQGAFDQVLDQLSKPVNGVNNAANSLLTTVGLKRDDLIRPAFVVSALGAQGYAAIIPNLKAYQTDFDIGEGQHRNEGTYDYAISVLELYDAFATKAQWSGMFTSILSQLLLDKNTDQIILFLDAFCKDEVMDRLLLVDKRDGQGEKGLNLRYKIEFEGFSKGCFSSLPEWSDPRERLFHAFADNAQLEQFRLKHIGDLLKKGSRWDDLNAYVQLLRHLNNPVAGDQARKMPHLVDDSLTEDGQAQLNVIIGDALTSWHGGIDSLGGLKGQNRAAGLNPVSLFSPLKENQFFSVVEQWTTSNAVKSSARMMWLIQMAASSEPSTQVFSEWIKAYGTHHSLNDQASSLDLLPEDVKTFVAKVLPQMNESRFFSSAARVEAWCDLFDRQIHCWNDSDGSAKALLLKTSAEIRQRRFVAVLESPEGYSQIDRGLLDGDANTVFGLEDVASKAAFAQLLDDLNVNWFELYQNGALTRNIQGVLDNFDQSTDANTPQAIISVREKIRNAKNTFDKQAKITAWYVDMGRWADNNPKQSAFRLEKIKELFGNGANGLNMTDAQKQKQALSQLIIQEDAQGRMIVLKHARLYENVSSPDDINGAHTTVQNKIASIQDCLKQVVAIQKAFLGEDRTGLAGEDEILNKRLVGLKIHLIEHIQNVSRGAGRGEPLMQAVVSLFRRQNMHTFEYANKEKPFISVVQHVADKHKHAILLPAAVFFKGSHYMAEAWIKALPALYQENGLWASQVEMIGYLQTFCQAMSDQCRNGAQKAKWTALQAVSINMAYEPAARPVASAPISPDRSAGSAASAGSSEGGSAPSSLSDEDLDGGSPATSSPSKPVKAKKLSSREKAKQAKADRLAAERKKQKERIAGAVSQLDGLGEEEKAKLRQSVEGGQLDQRNAQLRGEAARINQKIQAELADGLKRKHTQYAKDLAEVDPKEAKLRALNDARNQIMSNKISRKGILPAEEEALHRLEGEILALATEIAEDNDAEPARATRPASGPEAAAPMGLQGSDGAASSTAESSPKRRSKLGAGLFGSKKGNSCPEKGDQSSPGRFGTFGSPKRNTRPGDAGADAPKKGAGGGTKPTKGGNEE